MPYAAPKSCNQPGCGNLTHTSYCSLHKRDYGWKNDKQRGNRHQRGYNTLWGKTRLTILARDNYLCQECLNIGKITPAKEVDHIIPKKDGGTDDPSNLRSICIECHKIKTALEGIGNIRVTEQSAIPVIMVCGPPGAGKSTYINNHAEPRDIIIDLDIIQSELSGHLIYAGDSKWIRPAIAERNRRLNALSNMVNGKAWFIVSAPKVAERRNWKIILGNVSIIVIETPPEVCIERISNDQRRSKVATSQIEAVKRWWSMYSMDAMNETIIRGRVRQISGA